MARIMLFVTFLLCCVWTIHGGQAAKVFNDIASTGKRVDVPEVQRLPSSVREDALAAQKRVDDIQIEARQREQAEAVQRRQAELADQRRVQEQRQAEAARREQNKLAEQRRAREQRQAEVKRQEDQLAKQRQAEAAKREQNRLAEQRRLQERKQAELKRQQREQDASKLTDYSRPSGYRKGVRDDVWEGVREFSTGQVRDPVSGRFMSKNDPWDMGHKPSFEFRKHQKSAQERGIDRKQFLDEHSDSNKYRPELPKSNRGHKGEDRSDLYLGP